MPVLPRGDACRSAHFCIELTESGGLGLMMGLRHPRRRMEQTQVPHQSPEELIDRFVEAWNVHDMQALGSLFTNDANFVNVYGAWWIGRDKIRREHEGVHATVFRHSALRAHEVKSNTLAPGVATLHWRWSLSGMRLPNGAELPSRAGVMTFVAIERDAWLIAAGQNTDVVPPPGTRS